MGFIDIILDKLGLQRKERGSVQAPSENALSASVTRQMEANERTVGLVSDAVNNMLSAMYEQKAASINEFAEKIRSGTLTKQESDAYLQALFGRTDTTELSPEIQQALRDALEKRGREDKED